MREAKNNLQVYKRTRIRKIRITKKEKESARREGIRRSGDIEGRRRKQWRARFEEMNGYGKCENIPSRRS